MCSLVNLVNLINCINFSTYSLPSNNHQPNSMSTKIPAWLNRLQLFIRNVFHASWLFSPGVLFLGLTALCFWNLLQGKDVMLLAIQRRWFFALFLVTLIFLVLVGWYGARLVSEARKKKDPPGVLPYLSEFYYKHGPRFIGFSFFTITLLAFAQLPIFKKIEIPGWENGFYSLLFIASFFYYGFMTRILESRFTHISFNRLFFIVIGAILLLTILLSISLHRFRGAIFIVLTPSAMVFSCFRNYPAQLDARPTSKKIRGSS